MDMDDPNVDPGRQGQRSRLPGKKASFKVSLKVSRVTRSKVMTPRSTLEVKVNRYL